MWLFWLSFGSHFNDTGTIIPATIYYYSIVGLLVYWDYWYSITRDNDITEGKELGRGEGEWEREIKRKRGREEKGNEGDYNYSIYENE